MDTTNHMKASLLGHWEEYRSRHSTPFRISRLCAAEIDCGHRSNLRGRRRRASWSYWRIGEAIAAGMVIPIMGVTREPDEADETPHRHTF
jgi:hypothetical protein